MSISSSRASWPEGHPTSVHYIQVRKAFESGGGAYSARIVERHGTTVVVERLPDRAAATFVVARPFHLASVLARDDLTRWGGSPLALVSERYGVLAVATGPPEPPDQLSVLPTVTRLEDGETVEIPTMDEDQPSWQLFAAKVVTADADERGT
jgi:hypothetical protein